MTLEIRAEGSKACLKVRLGRFQNDPTMILAKRRRKILPNFVQTIFKRLG
jgi:hypothetical protein